MGRGGKICNVNSLSEFDDLLASNTYVVVDFFADWCSPCKAIASFYRNLAEDHCIDELFAFATVNVDYVPNVAKRYKVTAMPTFLFFKNGRQVAVNGQAKIQGANRASLGAAVEKVGGLAQKRIEEAKIVKETDGVEEANVVEEAKIVKETNGVKEVASVEASA